MTVAGTLNAETATSHNITVRATSDDGSTATQSFSITVSDEDEFDITIEDSELASLQTVGDVLALIAKKTNPATT